MNKVFSDVSWADYLAMMQDKSTSLRLRIEGWMLRQSTKATHKGIVLCDLNWDDTDEAAFVDKTKAALDLIEEKDRRRFRRVQREIRFIVNKELNTGGQYRRVTKVCYLDFGRYAFAKHPDWYLCRYAGVIVHEATHGALYSKGLMYNQQNRAQIERICHAEKYRFMRLAAPQWREHLEDEYDSSHWHFSWHASKWAKLRGIFARIKESGRKTGQVPGHADDAGGTTSG